MRCFLKSRCKQVENIMATNLQQNKCSANSQYCCVPYCNSDGRKGDNISFHKIPKENKKSWLVAIRRDEKRGI